MDCDLHSTDLCSQALISMIIVSWANNRASLSEPPPPPPSSHTPTHTHCPLSCPLPQRSGILLAHLDERLSELPSPVVFVVLSQTVWLQASESALHGPGCYAAQPQREDREKVFFFFLLIQSSRRALRGFVHI